MFLTFSCIPCCMLRNRYDIICISQSFSIYESPLQWPRQKSTECLTASFFSWSFTSFKILFESVLAFPFVDVSFAASSPFMFELITYALGRRFLFFVAVLLQLCTLEMDAVWMAVYFSKARLVSVIWAHKRLTP